MPAPGDKREGERWTLPQRMKNDAIYVALRLTLGAAALLPAHALRAAGRALGRAAFVLARSLRETSLANLARAMPHLAAERRRALARAAFEELGSHLGDATALLRPRAAFAPLDFETGALETIRDALAEGRGVVFASAHLGPWERVAATLVAAGLPLVTLARDAYDPRLTKVYDRLRSVRGVRSVYRGRPGAAAHIVRALRRGALLGAPMDLRSRVPSVDVPFLGVAAPTAVGPARIALRTRAPVVVGTAARVGGRLVIRARRIPTADLVAGDEAAIELTSRINDELSARIRAYPEGWPWMHPRWERADGRGGARPATAKP